MAQWTGPVYIEVPGQTETWAGEATITTRRNQHGLRSWSGRVRPENPTPALKNAKAIILILLTEPNQQVNAAVTNVSGAIPPGTTELEVGSLDGTIPDLQD